jgi:hypothetical protein
MNHSRRLSTHLGMSALVSQVLTLTSKSYTGCKLSILPETLLDVTVEHGSNFKGFKF